MDSVVWVRSQWSSSIIDERSVRRSGKAASCYNRASTLARCLNCIVYCRRIELWLRLAEVAKAEFIHGRRADGRCMRYVQLLRAGIKHTGEIAQRCACGLEFGVRIEQVVVVKIVVNGCLLIIRKSMVNFYLHLIAVVSSIGHLKHLASTPDSRNVLQQIHCHWIEARCRNLIVLPRVYVREYSRTEQRPTGRPRRPIWISRCYCQTALCRHRRCAPRTVVQDAGYRCIL